MEKKSLLEETLKRHKMLMEYEFYVPMAEDEVVEGIELEEQEEELPEEPVEDLGELPGGEESPMEDPMADAGGEEEFPIEEPMADVGAEEELPIEEPIEDPMAMAEPAGDEIEVDVTALVDTAEEAKEEVVNKMEDLMGKLSDLESKVGGMDQVISKITSLEDEIKQRNPTPIEKLELRSLDSYPYNVKLTDFWSDKGMLDTDVEVEEPELTLTMDDVKADYDEVNIAKSFDDDENNSSVFPTA